MGLGICWEEVWVGYLTPSGLTDVLCLPCMISGLLHESRLLPEKKGLTLHPVSLKGGGSSSPKVIATIVLHNSIHCLLGWSVESTFHKIMKLFLRSKITGYLTPWFIPH